MRFRRRLARRALALGWGLLLACPGLAQPQEPGSIRARLREAPSAGQVRMVLFDSAVTFGRFSDPARVEVFPAGERDLLMEGVPAGEYALVVHHDRNSDGEFDKNFIGIPTEPLAISRGYRPKGPPVWARASFPVTAGEERAFELELENLLGNWGRVGLGVGVIGRSNPYGGGGGVFQPIPAVSYNGDRLTWFGPTLRVGLVGSDQLRLAATASYRLRAYEEDDAAILQGLGDRSDTLMAGLALIGELPAGVNLSLGYEHDVLDEIGGGQARLEATRSFQYGVSRFSPKLALNWTGSDLADHDFGVHPSGALPARPAYDVGGVLTFEAGVGSFIELTRDWRLLFELSVEFLPDEVTDSPIVDEGQVFKGFFALTYVF
jgi:outer membrane protein